MGQGSGSRGQTNVAVVGPAVLGWLEPQGWASGFIFILLHALLFFFSLSSDQKIPESSSTLTPPETLQLKTA